MIDHSLKEKCCGCCACVNACPKACIRMQYDEEGFLFPLVDTEQCIQCGLCEKVCQIYHNHDILKTDATPKVYACHNLDEDKRNESSSGGISVILAEYVIRKQGVVFGAVYDEEMYVCHQKIDNYESIKNMQKSKYVQSDIKNTYQEALQLLKENVLVLFTGTPCQIGGLYQFLQKDYDNLITMDIICFGVPSPKIFKDYISWFKKEKKEEISNIDFRNKNNGWNKSSTQIICKSGKEYLTNTNENHFYNIFRSHIAIRKSCNYCLYTNLHRYSDISVGDYWGIESYDKEYDTFKGVSKVLLNTKKGQEIWKKIEDKLYSKEMSIQSAIRPNLIAPSKEHKKRKEFFEYYGRHGFIKAYNKYIGASDRERIIAKAKKKIKHFIVKCIN